MGNFWKQIEEDLGFNDDRMNRDRPYSGQPHTDTGLRGATEVKGITFRDLRDCFIRGFIMAGNDQCPAAYKQACKGPDGLLCENDLYKLDLNKVDVMAAWQNISCEIEKIMGIWPNVPKLTTPTPQGGEGE